LLGGLRKKSDGSDPGVAERQCLVKESRPEGRLRTLILVLDTAMRGSDRVLLGDALVVDCEQEVQTRVSFAFRC